RLAILKSFIEQCAKQPDSEKREDEVVAFCSANKINLLPPIQQVSKFQLLQGYCLFVESQINFVRWDLTCRDAGCGGIDASYDPSPENKAAHKALQQEEEQLRKQVLAEFHKGAMLSDYRCFVRLMDCYALHFALDDIPDMLHRLTELQPIVDEFHRRF